MKYSILISAILLAGTCALLGYFLGASQDYSADALQIALSAIVALVELGYIVVAQPILMKREQKAGREFEADKSRFQEIIKTVPEETMAYFDGACAESGVHGVQIAVLCDFIEQYRGMVLKEFHDKSLRREFDLFFNSVDDFISFTSVHLFPVGCTLNLSLRQGTQNGIENDRAAFKELANEYNSLCNEMIKQYRSFAQCGKKYLGC